MQNEITDPAEQQRVISEFAAASRQQRSDEKGRSAWTQQVYWLLGVAAVSLVVDQIAGISGWFGGHGGAPGLRVAGILFVAGGLGLLAAKLSAIEEKLDRLLDQYKKSS